MQRIRRLWQSGWTGKIAVGCSSLIVLLLACGILGVLFNESTEPVTVPETPRGVAKTEATTTPKLTRTLNPTHTTAPTPPETTAQSEPTNTPQPTHTSAPTHTPLPTSTPGLADGPTPLPVVDLDEEVQTDTVILTFSEAEQTASLPGQDQVLRSEGQWIIAYGEARNPTPEEAWLYPHHFVLTSAAQSGYIFADEEATEAAERQLGVESVVAGSIGAAIKPGATVPIAVAFDVPEEAGQVTLWIVNAETGVSLGSVEQFGPVGTPTATAAPTTTPTSTPEPTDTPHPTSTPSPTAVPTAEGVPPDAVEAHLSQVVDGDTIEVRVNGEIEKVRYVGIDTPERGQPGYQAATEANRQLLGDGPLYLARDRSDRDRYGRLLRYVYTADGAFVEAEMLAQGWAQPVEYPPDTSHADEFRQLTRAAAEAGRGFWSGTSPYDGAMSYGLVTRAANIRRGPGTGFQVSGGATAGTPLTIFGRNEAGDWLQVRTPDRSGGWMTAFLVDVNVPVSTIPVPENVPTPVVTPTVPIIIPTIIPTSPPTTDVCSCAGNIYNCSDFATHSQAQACFEYCGGVNNDVHRLDRDNDGIACESLP